MIDWSDIFNIIFLAVAGAFIVFLLVSVIAVAVKGKRRCGSFDVVLRIIASLVFAISLCMLFFSVSAMLKGDFRVVVVPEILLDGVSVYAAKLIVGTSVVPLSSGLFVLLADAVGAQIVAVLVICSLAALIVDCLVANKKVQKAKRVKQPKTSAKPVKTPEQIAREVEIARIRKLGESAVKKTEHAARVTEQSSQTTESGRGDIAVNDTQTDWRVDTQKPASSEFVGIKDGNDDFDNFDSFDDRSAESEDNFTENNIDTEQEGAGEDIVQSQFDGQDESYENISSDTEFDDGVADTETDENNMLDSADTEDVFVSDTDTEDNAENDSEAQPYADFVEQDVTEKSEPQAESIETDGVFGYDLAQSKKQGTRQSERHIESQAGIARAQKPTARVSVAEKPAYSSVSADSRLSYVGTKHTDVTAEYDYAQVEPNRDIYTPTIRTIVRSRTQEKQDVKIQAEKKPKRGGRSSAAGKSNAQKQKTKSQSQSGVGSVRTTVNSQNIDDKKLPMTRRYVILDRRNAVNMFGEYLKERNRSDKEKLQSSIDTIIIE